MFQDALYSHLQNMATWQSGHGLLARLIENRTKKKYANVLGVLELVARARLGLNPTGDQDWEAKSIDWTKLLGFLMQILPLILALFGL